MLNLLDYYIIYLMSESFNGFFEKEPTFNAELNNIVNKPIQAESIDNYADSALEDLIGLIQRVIEAYKFQPTHEFVTTREVEMAAFHYYGLSNLEQTLDYIAAKSDEIRKLDDVISGAAYTDRVITPPDPTGRNEIVAGDGSFEAKKKIPRLKTVLFILMNEYGIDVTDEEQVKIIWGPVRPNMIRKQSYHSIQVNQLGKTILVCDEQENATYVLNDEALDIDRQAMLDMTKLERNTLISLNPYIGQRIEYSQRFVVDIIEALNEQIDSELIPTTEVGENVLGSYLNISSRKNIRSTSGLAKLHGVSNPTIEMAVHQLGEALGEIGQYRFGVRVTTGYLPEQQELILQWLKEKGYLAELAPKGVLTALGLAEELGVSRRAVVGAVEKLGESLGSIELYRFGPKITQGYSEVQQELIRQQLELDGFFSDEAPENVRAITGIARLYGSSNPTIEKAIAELGESLGDVKLYRFNGTIAAGYSEEQQELIRQWLEQNGYFTEAPPDNVISVVKLADKLSIDARTVRVAVENIRELLGEVKNYRFKNVVTEGFSEMQQELIRQWLEQNGYLVGVAPDNVLSRRGLKELWRVEPGPILVAIEKLGDSLGEIKNYRFGNNIAPGYSEAQQQLIRQSLELDGYFVEVAPEGVLSRVGMANLWGVSPTTIKTALKYLSDKLGEDTYYKFSSRRVVGYTEQQQKIIREHLEKNGVFDAPPEGFLHESGVAQRFGVQNHTIRAVVQEIGESIGEIRGFKSDSRATPHYSPAQQELIYSRLKEKNLLLSDAPDNMLSISGIAKGLDLTVVYVSKVVKDLAGEIGEASYYKGENGHSTAFFTEAQQEQILNLIMDRGMWAPQAPNDILSKGGMSIKFGVSSRVVNDALEALGDAIGNVETYKFKASIAKGYSPEQQQMVYEHLDAKGAFSPKPPDGYLSMSGFVRAFGISDATFVAAVNQLIDNLGEVRVYRFGTSNTKGYSPEQQLKIRQTLGLAEDPTE